MRSSRFALAASVLVLGATSAGSASTAVAAPGPGVRDSRAPDILVQSAWGRRNGVTAAACTGIGRARQSEALTQHPSFRCRVAVGGKSGVVLARALGPEWLRVASIVAGKLEPDHGIGPVPKGSPTLESLWAGSALVRSSWARTHRIQTAFCFGVGEFREIGHNGYLFFAYSCSTVDRSGRRGAQVLATVTGSDSVRVVRTLAR